MDGSASGGLGGLSADRLADNVVIGEVVRPSSHRLTLGIATAVIVIIGLGLFLLRPTYFPVSAVESTKSAVLCERADWCLIAYLSPWDASSVRTRKLLSDVDEALPDGVTLEGIWGAGDPDDLEAMAEQYGERAFIDPTETVVRHFKLETVPAWFLVDAKGRAIERMEGTYVPIEYHLSKLGLLTYGEP